MTSEANSNAAPSANGSAKAQKEPQYRMDPAQIPQDLRQTVAAKMSPEADVYPAKDGGNYKGRIVHADERFVVQAIGKSEKTAVVHERADVEIKGASLLSRAANNDLVNRNVQIHYDAPEKAGRMYPYNPQKEQEQREAGAAERRTSMVEKITAAARDYAAESFSTPKARNTFLEHFEGVMAKVAQQQERAKEAPQQDRGQQQQAPARQH